MLDSARPTPRHYAMWMFTAACPSRCRYCDLESQKRAGTMGRSEIERVAAELLEAGFGEVMFAGGEPLLSPHLPAALAVLRGRVPTTVFTGGLPGLEERSIEVLREGGVSRVVCSLDAGTERRNDDLRGRVGVTAGLLRFAELLRAELPRVGRSVNTVVSPFNAGSLDELWDRVEPLGFRSWSLTLAGDFFEASHPGALLSVPELEAFYFDTVPRLAARLARTRAELVVLPIPFPLLARRVPPIRFGEQRAALAEELAPELERFARGELNRTFVERCGCPLPGIDVVIGVGGQVHPCSQAPIIQPAYVIGNVKDVPLHAILASDALETFRRELPHPPCRRCWAPSNIPASELVRRVDAARSSASTAPR